jgi:hypothetical protein
MHITVTILSGETEGEGERDAGGERERECTPVQLWAENFLESAERSMSMGGLRGSPKHIDAELASDHVRSALDRVPCPTLTQLPNWSVVADRLLAVLLPGDDWQQN